MEKVLSQEEVDSLLSGIGEGRVDTETDVPEPDLGLIAYDFTGQDGPIHGKLPGLSMINERLATLLRTSLTNATGSEVDVNISSAESLKFNEFCRSLPLPTSLNVFKIKPLQGSAILVLEAPLIFSFVDAFFGGKGANPVKLEGRGFTRIEMKIVDRVVGLVLGEMENAWSDIHKVEMSFIKSEMDPKFAAIVVPSDRVIVIRLMAHLENTSGQITVCLPYSMIEPLKEKLSYRFQAENVQIDEVWKKRMFDKIKDFTVTMICTLGKSHISSRELLELKTGDVIQLEQGINSPVMVCAEGIPKFMGYPGSYNNRKAIRIESRLNKE